MYETSSGNRVCKKDTELERKTGNSGKQETTKIREHSSERVKSKIELIPRGELQVK